MSFIIAPQDAENQVDIIVLVFAIHTFTFGDCDDEKDPTAFSYRSKQVYGHDLVDLIPEPDFGFGLI